MPTDLIGQSDENLLAGFDLLARHPPSGAPVAPRTFGAAVAYLTRRSSAYFNPIAILEPASAADIVDAAAWMREAGVEFSLRVRADLDDDAVGRAAGELGMEPDPFAEPGMALHPLPAPPPPPARLTIEEATAATLDRWYAANVAGFDMPADRNDLAAELIPPAAASDPVARLFGGYLDGAPVGCSIAIRGATTVGVYAVGTAARARRQGVGSAMTWAAVDAGRQWGLDVAVLQASEMGAPVYRAMGFREVTRYVTYYSRADVRDESAT